MKQVILSLFLLPSLYVLAQDKSVEKNVDLNVVGNLVASRATVREVTDKFGEASKELIRPEKSLLQYKSNGRLYIFKFDEKRKLYDFIFTDQTKNLPDRLSYEDMKQARDLRTKAEIQNKLGQPTQVIVNSENETWYYTVGKETTPKKTLIIRFDPASPTIVKSYNYYADFDNAHAFSSDVVNLFIKGSTSSADIEKGLGKPSKIILNSESENWYYTSKNSTLIVYFDKQSKLNDFLYQRGTEQLNN